MALFILLTLTLGRLDRSSGYEDLSFNKSTAQSPIYMPCTPEYCEYYRSSGAVDRRNDTCMRTSQIGPHSGYYRTWWQVDFGSICNVYKVHIMFKDYGSDYELRQKGRFAGFSLFLSNSSNIEDGLLCYKDGPSLPSLDFNTTCVGYARYLFFYNERLPGVQYPDGYGMLSYTELCEVIVLGCEDVRFYGINCDLQCPENCQDNTCHIVNGTCFSCKPGWRGGFCNKECPSWSYGLDCKYQCSGHCLNELPCNHVTGECPEKCAAGWTGTFCEKQCDYGNFGPNCAFNCSGHCENNATCNEENGHCDSGCNAGYRGELCDEACAFGKFGVKCANICSGNCLYNETCNIVNGICSKGCAPGYFGSLCSKECLPGFYGINCQYRCSGQCVNEETCSRYDGSCSLGCKDNYVGVACDFLRDSSTSASTVGLSVVVAVYSLCFIAAFVHFYLRSHSCNGFKERIPKFATKGTKSEPTASPKTNTSDDNVHNYQDLNVNDEKNSYEIMQASENQCAYQNLDLEYK